MNHVIVYSKRNSCAAARLNKGAIYKKTTVTDGGLLFHIGTPDIVMEQPGQAIPTEGFHEYAVDVMNTSFSLVRDKDTAK